MYEGKEKQVESEETVPCLTERRLTTEQSNSQGFEQLFSADKKAPVGKKKGRKTKAEQLTVERARANSIASIKELFQTKKRSLEISWEKTARELSLEISPAKKKRATEISDQSGEADNNSTLPTRDPLAVSSPIDDRTMDQATAEKILRELKETRTENKKRFDELEKSFETQTQSQKENYEKAMEVFQRKQKERDEFWRGALAKVQEEVKEMRTQMEVPREQLAVKLTEELEMRVIEKIQNPMINENPVVKELESKLKLVMNLFDREERQIKKKNITISGLVIDVNTVLKVQVNDFLNSRFNTLNPVEDAFLVGPEKKIIKVVLTNREDKDLILKKKKMVLGGTQIYINPDLTNREAKIGKQLREVARAHREAGGKARVRGSKIMLDKDWWYWDENVQRLEKSDKAPKNGALGRKKASPRASSTQPGRREELANVSKNGEMIH